MAEEDGRNIHEDSEKRAAFIELLFGHKLLEVNDAQRINVSTRVSAHVVNVLDALIELGAFSSRSEAVATYLEYAIDSKPQLYEELVQRAAKIRKFRSSAMILDKDLVSDSKSPP